MPTSSAPARPGTFSDGDRVELLIGDAGAVHRLTDDRNNGAKVFSAGELRDDAAVVCVHELRRDDVREHLAAVAHNCRRGLVAGALDSEYQSVAHHPPSYKRPAVVIRCLWLRIKITCHVCTVRNTAPHSPLHSV